MHFGAINILLSQINEAMRNVSSVQVGIEVGQRQQKWSWKIKLFMVKIHV